MDNVFAKYQTARSLHRELMNILLLCVNDSNFYYCYCDDQKRCSLCEFCEYFPNIKIDNMTCEKFLQLNRNKKDKLDELLTLLKPFYDKIKSEKENALEFFYKEYYWFSRDISAGRISYVTLDEIIESKNAE